MLVRAFVTIALLAVVPSYAEDARPEVSPWGIASSASGYKDHAEWFPKMREAGLTTVRLFPEWGTVQPAKDVWKWDAADVLVKNAADNGLRINGILMGRAPGSKAPAHTFPMDRLDDWSAYVAATIGRYKGQVRHWEVWNEGNGGFNGGKHTTADYARLAAAAYAAGRNADPSAKIGLTVASYDPAYLHQAALAMAKEGKPGSFDFLAIHPYEIADGLRDEDGEIPFLWMSHRLRELIRTSVPDKADVPIWITEIGQRIGHQATSDTGAARAIVKLYTMALAQGIECTQWFEARDPSGEEAGFGLLKRDGLPRPAYLAIQSLANALGPKPNYHGWIRLGESGRGFGFVFQGVQGVVVVAWMPAGLREEVMGEQHVGVANPLRGPGEVFASKSGLVLGDEPRLVYPAEWGSIVELAKANAARPFPWGGDHAAATSVAVTLGQRDERAGVFQTSRKSTPHCTFPDGSTGIIVRGDQAVNFYAHPSFASLSEREFHIRITVRRLAPGNVGMNLFYEVADSQGKTSYRNKGTWFSVPAGDGWHTTTWHVTDACFAKMWGYDFSIRPEQSAPFVIGKVEVGRKPF